jgi:soluble lytic murein transglycosylase
MGATEVAALLKEYRGSYIMTLAGYNAGRGRVQQWVAQYGDPRDPKVDTVDGSNATRSPRPATTSSV